MPITIRPSVIFFSSSYSVGTVLTKPCTFELRMRLIQYATTNNYKRSRKSKWPELVAKYQLQWTRIMMNTRLDSSVLIKYVPMHTIRVITRLAQNARRTDRASASSRLRLGFASATSHLRLDYALASISCEHCRSSRNNPHYAPRHIIYYSKFSERYFVKSKSYLTRTFTGIWSRDLVDPWP